jgi:hypothetical protein
VDDRHHRLVAAADHRRRDLTEVGQLPDDAQLDCGVPADVVEVGRDGLGDLLPPARVSVDRTVQVSDQLVVDLFDQGEQDIVLVSKTR